MGTRPRDFEEERGSVSERGDEAGCCLGIMKSPSIILRNMIMPRDMWDEFPRGLTLTISDYFLYQPSYPWRADQTTIQKPSELFMPYEECWITTEDDVKLYAFLIKQNPTEVKGPLPTLIFFHGNAGSIGDRLVNAQLLHNNLPIHILLVEYRGYGPSKGVPSENGLYLDAKAAFAFVEGRKDLESDKIFVFGRSLGGAVAINLCSAKEIRDRVAGLIVENTFTSVPSLAKKIFEIPGIKFLPRWFYNNKFENKKKVGKLKCPTLFITSEKDELLPIGMMIKLFNMCRSPRKKLVILNAGHNDAYTCDEYVEVINGFIQAALRANIKPHLRSTCLKPSPLKKKDKKDVDTPPCATSASLTNQPVSDYFAAEPNLPSLPDLLLASSHSNSNTVFYSCTNLSSMMDSCAAIAELDLDSLSSSPNIKKYLDSTCDTPTSKILNLPTTTTPMTKEKLDLVTATPTNKRNIEASSVSTQEDLDSTFTMGPTEELVQTQLYLSQQ